MSDTGINVGTYGTGAIKHWDVKADKNAVAGNQKADDAVNTAKAHSGAEVVTIDGAGNASAHSLSLAQGTFFHPPKSGTLTADNLTVSTDRSKNDGKPLAIAPDIAGKLGGQNALIVDEKNQVAYVGSDKNGAADAYLNAPDTKKVAAAYAIAGNDDHVNKKMAANVIGALNQDFRSNLTNADHDISLLKGGPVKDKVKGLISDLGNLDNKARDLDSQIVAPKERLGVATNNWNNANNDENGKINSAKENLRENKFPGIHQAEGELGVAKNALQNANSGQDQIQTKVNQAQARVNALDQIPNQINGLKQQADQLKVNNAELLTSFNLALVQKKGDLIWTSEDLVKRASSLESQARAEGKKPVAPAPSPNPPSGGGSNTADPFSGTKPATGGSNTADPFSGSKTTTTTGKSNTADPFSGTKPSGGTSNTADPFSGTKPSGGGNSVTADPFSNNSNAGSFRDQSKIDRLQGAANQLRNDAKDLRVRADRIDQLFTVVNISRNLGSDAVITAVQNMDHTSNYGYKGYSDLFSNTDFGPTYKGYTFFNADTNDKLAIWNNYIQPTKDNNSAIYNKGQQAIGLQNKYSNEHPQAVQDLNGAQDALKNASGSVGYATAQVQQKQGGVDQINNNPQPDSSPKVKAAQKNLDKAVDHKESVVGENAPLTVEKNSASKAFNDLVEKIRNNSGNAQNLINNTKQDLGL